MKKSVGEFSLIIVTIVGIVLISAVTTNLINGQTNFVLNFFDSILNDDENIQKNDKDDNSLNVNLKSDFGYKNSYNNISHDKLINLFDIDIETDDSFTISDENKNKLSKVVKKDLKKIESNKLECINECKELENDVEYKYYKTDDGYIVNVSDTKQEYSLVYENKKYIFGIQKYGLVNAIYNDNYSYEMENNELKSSEENNIFVVDNTYNDSYLLKADVNTNKMFSSDKSLIDNIYNNNINRIVMLNTYNNDVIVDRATGFFFKDNIIVTSCTYIENSLKKGTSISALTSSKNNYNILGVIAMDDITDVALLKISGSDNTPSNIQFGNINVGDELLLLGTFSGFGVSGRIGSNISNNDNQTNALYTSLTNIGSPLFNSSGQIVGMVTSASNNKTLSNSVSSNVLKKFLKIFRNVNDNNIKYYSIEELAKDYFRYNVSKEIKKDGVLDTVWNKYKDVGDLENTIPLNVIKRSSTEYGISLRYVNNTNVDNDIVIKPFINKLLEDKYKKVLNTNKKKIYKGKYRVLIYYDFNYIIILIGDY